MTTTHTVDEALDRFELISAQGSPDDNTACAMTALAWIAGEAWTDHPECANRVLANNVITANDAPGTTVEQRAELVRAGEQGVIDTWWVPDTVVAWTMRVEKDEEITFYDRVLRSIRRIAEWKADKVRPDLRDAVLSGAVLRDAVLSGAVLRGADLRGAVLRDAVLSGADLSGADLRGAVLRDADLRDAVLRDAVLRDAVLSGADLRGADLSGADLRGAVGSPWTASQLPEGSGWTLNGETFRFEAVAA